MAGRDGRHAAGEHERQRSPRAGVHGSLTSARQNAGATHERTQTPGAPFEGGGSQSIKATSGAPTGDPSWP